jgi:flagellin
MSIHALRLATGKKVNSAADDAAGFTIASKLYVKSEGLGTALDNIGSAKNVMTVAKSNTESAAKSGKKNLSAKTGPWKPVM